jgi:hypothetical protein
MAGIGNAAEKIIRGLDRMQELRASASFFIQKTGRKEKDMRKIRKYNTRSPSV